MDPFCHQGGPNLTSWHPHGSRQNLVLLSLSLDLYAPHDSLYPPDSNIQRSEALGRNRLDRCVFGSRPGLPLARPPASPSTRARAGAGEGAQRFRLPGALLLHNFSLGICRTLRFRFT